MSKTDTILKSFNKTVAKLRKVAETENAAFVRQMNVIDEAMVKKEAHAAEAARAAGIADKIEGLIS